MTIETDEAVLARAKNAKVLLGEAAEKAKVLLGEAAEKAKVLLGEAAEAIEADEPAKVLLSKTAEDAKTLLNEAAEKAKVLLGKAAEDADALLSKATKTAEVLLARVNRLEGFITICSYCKEIRYDQDSWQQLEQYLEERSDATFSHGICPRCLKEQVQELESLPQKED